MGSGTGRIPSRATDNEYYGSFNGGVGLGVGLPPDSGRGSHADIDQSSAMHNEGVARAPHEDAINEVGPQYPIETGWRDPSFQPYPAPPGNHPRHVPSPPNNHYRNAI